MKITPRPALYFLIPYLLGIVAGSWTSIPFLWLWLSVLLSFIGGIATRNRRRYLAYGLLHLAVFAGGMLRLDIAAVSPVPDHFYDAPVSFSGVTTYQPDRGTEWEECYAVGELQRLSEPSQHVKAKFLIKFQDAIPLRYGKQITLTGVLQEPQGKRNPGGFDYKAHLARQNVIGIVEAIGLLRIGEQRGFPPLRWIEALRIRTERLIDTTYTETLLHAQLVKGILLGKRSEVPSETLDTFRNSGTFHVLAVSGLHVGLIAAFCYLGFSRFRLQQKIVCLLTIIAVLIYACLVGFRPSVFRAALMATLFLFAALIDRDADIFNLLAFAALVLLLLNPYQLWDVGFQLSFVAVASIVYLVPKMEKPLQHLWQSGEESSEGSLAMLTRVRHTTVKWFILSYLVTLAAQIGTAPLIAYHFFRTYPLGMIVGPFAVGLVSLIVAMGMGLVCIGFTWLPLAKFFSVLNHAIISIFLLLIWTFGQTWGVVKLTPPTFGGFVLYIAVCLGITHWRWVRRQWRAASLIGLSVVAIWVWDAAFHEKGRLLEVVTLDVGQGDAAIVRFPDNRTMLIDGGIRRTYYDEKKMEMVDYDVGERIIEPYLDFYGIRKLDMVVLTHPDLDHGGGLGYILENFQVSRVLGIPDMPRYFQTDQRLQAIAEARDIPYAFPYAGEIPLTPTATLNLLHPIDAASTNLLDEDKNDDSLVIKLSYGEVDVLFTGDIGKDAEARLVASGQDLRAEILKVPHHGSRTSSSAPFLDAVQPRCAIFSLGKGNRYQFPHPEVVARYAARECRLWRTDASAAITLRTDGTRCWIEGLAISN
ncbi:DNA internalization-related competence protein ComEC/Rec2 [Candidatus Poribacteria bacterium]|nr:DNA internalization-related competence protein ComEC/Rec2 [Candidatus Poribacteria bacterium]MYK17427.1 DNA internalization-related competence protein ComEC/Rec2 [Candidatus Poribacteria bacterium]